VVDQNLKFSVVIAASSSIAGRIRETMSFRNDVVFHISSLHSLTPRTLRTFAPDLLLCEYCNTDDEKTYRLLADIRSRNPLLQIFVITDTPDHASAVRYLKMGVGEYIALPTEQNTMYERIESAVDEWKSKRARKTFHHDRRKSYDFQNIIGNSPPLQNVINRSRKLLDNPNITVLIQGETGTGKELMAKAIHYNSRNSDEPFVEIACSSIPENLLESELFGHEKGAFTDAKNQKIGLFELAGKGTIFLDEIGDISPVIQSKLLNVLEEKKIRRLGGIEDITIHARIITATSKDVLHMVKHGTMRKDLYYRLAVFAIELPPLRERTGDIPQLARHFLHDFARENSKNIRGFTPQALEKLSKGMWEGNVRELKHVIERAVLLSSNERLDEDDLEMISRSDVLPQNGNGESVNETAQELSPNDITISIPLSNASFSQVEKELVRVVLKKMRGNKKKASEILKISRPRLDRLLSDDPQFFASAIE
jgi:DNA-binding NtrC family response regulator